MDAGEDIIDVLYRIRDPSNSPRIHQRLNRSQTSRPTEDTLQQHGGLETQRRNVEHQVSAPPPPRNYERDLYHLTRRSFAYRGNNSHRLPDTNSVFHNKHNFNPPPSQPSFYGRTRIRSYSGHHENTSAEHTRRRRQQDSITCRPHNSEDSLDVDFEKSRSIRVDVVPREDVVSKDSFEEDLVLMPNGTRQRRRRRSRGDASSNLNALTAKTTLHRTDNQTAVSSLTVETPSKQIKQDEKDEEIYSTAAAVLESPSDIYENVQLVKQQHQSEQSTHLQSADSKSASAVTSGYKDEFGSTLIIKTTNSDKKERDHTEGDTARGKSFNETNVNPLLSSDRNNPEKRIRSTSGSRELSDVGRALNGHTLSVTPSSIKPKYVRLIQNNNYWQ